MHMGRITVPLDSNEATALRQMSELDCRPPHDQIRHLIREEANRRVLITSDTRSEKKNQAVSEHKATRNDPTSDPRHV